ncbi:hypothetical protein [Sphingomonas sp. PAMC 26605]|uniref:hypothetical protein n=1 Tax=Sphingomonas sp. PAMC 26605 TaxID=1112214 RepID=UPI00026CDCD6|nr:hypothetical protein [Sphingomonas sp. PAMC 26605]
MPLSIHAAHLQHQIDTQLELAGLARCDAIRALHEDLEKLYRLRLVALVLAERLAEARAIRFEVSAWPLGMTTARDVTLPV